MQAEESKAVRRGLRDHHGADSCRGATPIFDDEGLPSSVPIASEMNRLNVSSSPPGGFATTILMTRLG